MIITNYHSTAGEGAHLASILRYNKARFTFKQRSYFIDVIFLKAEGNMSLKNFGYGLPNVKVAEYYSKVSFGHELLIAPLKKLCRTSNIEL